MNPLSLFSGPYGLFIKLGLCAAAIGGAVFAWHSYTSGLIADGHTAGMAECTTSYTLRDNRALQAALAAQTAAEARATRLEQDAATAQSKATTAYSKGVSDAKKRADVAIAAVRAGSLRLSDPGTSGTCPAVDSKAGQAETSGSAGGSNGLAGGGRLLSEDASVFLASEADRANKVVLKLQAARARILSDLAVCNAP